MFKKNYWFLRILTLFYLSICLYLCIIFYYLLIGMFMDSVKNPIGNDSIFKSLGKWWLTIPIFSIINGIISPFFVASIYLHFKYTNNRKYLKYTWFCIFNSFLEDFFLIRPIFLIIFMFKIWSRKVTNNENNSNTSYKHIITRSIFNMIFIIFICIYFITFSLLRNHDAVGYGSMCMIFYGLVPKLVMNSYIDIKFSNENFSNKWITKYLISQFFGIFPYCYYLIKNPIILNK